MMASTDFVCKKNDRRTKQKKVQLTGSDHQCDDQGQRRPGRPVRSPREAHRRCDGIQIRRHRRPEPQTKPTDQRSDRPTNQPIRKQSHATLAAPRTLEASRSGADASVERRRSTGRRPAPAAASKRPRAAAAAGPVGAGPTPTPPPPSRSRRWLGAAQVSLWLGQLHRKEKKGGKKRTAPSWIPPGAIH